MIGCHRLILRLGAPFDPERVGTHQQRSGIGRTRQGQLPMRRVAEFEAERRHLLEMELRAERLSARRQCTSRAGKGEHDRHERGREKIHRSNALEAHPV